MHSHSDTFILADADALWPKMIRVCNGPLVLIAALPQQHGEAGGVGALHRSVAAFSSSDSRLAVGGYLIPRSEPDASLHNPYPYLGDKSEGSAKTAAEPAEG
jgi:hypothetical protein